MDDDYEMSFLNQLLAGEPDEADIIGLPVARTRTLWTHVNLQSMHDSLDDLLSPDNPEYSTMSDSTKGSDGAVNPGEQRSRSKQISPANAHRILRSYLAGKGAVSAVVYERQSPDPQSNDIWPNVRDHSRVPVRYYRAVRSSETQPPPVIPSNARPVWPPGKIPTEIYEDIASHLSRDDIKAMRMVCREFYRHVSQVLFKTVVVPFNREIYGMLVDDVSLGTKLKEKAKGKTNRDPIKSMWWANADREDVYDGHALDVFRRFGPHIVRFGMSFEVDEASLANLPEKHVTQTRTSFWGVYQWPRAEYCRYDGIANIEIAADETTRMKQAFSELTRVQELALSLNHGLGWLQGPELSIRSQILEQPPHVFGTAHPIPDRLTQSRREFWNYLNSCHRTAGSDVKKATLYQARLPEVLSNFDDGTGVLDKLGGLKFLSPSVVDSAVPCDSPLSPGHTTLHLKEKQAIERSQNTTKVMFTSVEPPTELATRYRGLIPAILNQAQKEWLMEVGWAQRAFISSYIISVLDNPDIFANVHTMNIARIPDCLLPNLTRQDFWAALPSLKNAIVMVLPSWRDVTKDKAAIVEVIPLQPTDRLDLFYAVLQTIGEHAGIKQMTFGWAAGGEHAEGLFARNRLILPAPVLPRDSLLEAKQSDIPTQLLKFRHVEDLTLVNCWITPPALIEFTIAHARLGLEKLRLKSVSLCGFPRGRPNNGNMGPVFTIPGQFNHAGVDAHTNPVQTLITPAGLQQQVQALQTQIQRAQARPDGHKATWILEFQQEQLRQLQRRPVPPQYPGVPSIMSIPQMYTWRFSQNNPPVTPPLTSPSLPGLGIAATGGGVPLYHPMAAPPPPLIHRGVAQVSLHAAIRYGSWTWVLDQISPGRILCDFGNPFGQGQHLHIPETKFKSIEFESCGYVDLQRMVIEHFDRAEDIFLNLRPPSDLANFYNDKRVRLQKFMIQTTDNLLGQILTDLDSAEAVVLTAGWFMELGWKDQEAAEAALFDVATLGGTARFSGTIHASDLEEDVAAGSCSGSATASN
jgi:hypothetical protein